jgi:hypothetical protein
LKNIEVSHNLDLKAKVEYVEGETSCSKNRCVKNKTNLETKVKHVEKESNEEIGREISKRIYYQRFQKYLYYH